MIIYKIENVLNGKFYIGSTINPSQREKQHFTNLRCNRHPNPKLQNAWNKYGEANFQFIVVEHVSSGEDLIIREQHYLDTLKPFYNIRTVADRNTGVKPSATAMLNFKKSHVKFCKPVLQYDIQGNLIKKWSGVNEVAQNLNLSRGTISSCCNGKIKSYGGFIFQFENQLKPYKGTGKIPAQASKENGQKSAKTYKITYSDGVVKTFTNFSEYCRQNDLDRGQFKAYIGKNTMSRLGFTLERVNDIKQ